MDTKFELGVDRYVSIPYGKGKDKSVVAAYYGTEQVSIPYGKGKVSNTT